MAEGQRCKYPDGFKRNMDTGKVMTNEEVRVMQLEKRELYCAEAESDSEWFSIAAVVISDFDYETEMIHDLRATGRGLAMEQEEEDAREREQHDRKLRVRAIARQAEGQRDQLGEQINLIEDWQDMLSETRGRRKVPESTCMTSEKRMKTGHWKEPRGLQLPLQVDERS